MPNKIVALITGILFFITTQTTSAQSDEKWLPSSISLYSSDTTDVMAFHFEYDTLNRLAEFITFTNQDQISIKNGKKLEYDLDNNLVKSIEYLSINDSIVSRSELGFKLLNGNKIELRNAAYYTGILHLDEGKKILIKLEETTTDSIQTKYVTTTFEYRNDLLYKRIENTIIEIHPQKVEGESQYIPSESKTESTSHTYEIKTDKLFPLNNFYPRWLLTYLKIDDLIVFPSVKFDSSDSDKEIESEIDVTYHYNNENYLTGWTVIDPNEDEKIHCEIEYIKAK